MVERKIAKSSQPFGLTVAGLGRMRATSATLNTISQREAAERLANSVTGVVIADQDAAGPSLREESYGFATTFGLPSDT